MVEVFGWLADFQGEGNWFMLTVLACLVTILARTVIWMFAHAFNMQEQERNSKAEIIQAFATILLTVWLVFIIQQAEAMAIKDILGDASYVNCGASQIPVVKPDGATINGLEVVNAALTKRHIRLPKFRKNLRQISECFPASFNVCFHSWGSGLSGKLEWFMVPRG